MKVLARITLIIIISFATAAMSAAAPATNETIQVIKISPQDARAVIKTPDGKTQIIKPGDSLGTSGKVTEIAADRIVIEQKKGSDIEKVIIRLVDGKQKIERLRNTGEQSQPILAPAEKKNTTEKQPNSFK